MGFGSVSSLILQLLDFVSEQIGPDAAEKISDGSQWRLAGPSSLLITKRTAMAVEHESEGCSSKVISREVFTSFGETHWAWAWACARLPRSLCSSSV
jgi:hypothetical protein